MTSLKGWIPLGCCLAAWAAWVAPLVLRADAASSTAPNPGLIDGFQHPAHNTSGPLPSGSNDAAPSAVWHDLPVVVGGNVVASNGGKTGFGSLTLTAVPGIDGAGKSPCGGIWGSLPVSDDKTYYDATLEFWMANGWWKGPAKSVYADLSKYTGIRFWCRGLAGESLL